MSPVLLLGGRRGGKAAAALAKVPHLAGVRAVHLPKPGVVGAWTACGLSARLMVRTAQALTCKRCLRPRAA